MWLCRGDSIISHVIVNSSQKKTETLIGRNLVALVVVFIIFHAVTAASLHRDASALSPGGCERVTAAETHMYKKHMYHN